MKGNHSNHQEICDVKNVAHDAKLPKQEAYHNDGHNGPHFGNLKKTLIGIPIQNRIALLEAELESDEGEPEVHHAQNRIQD